MLMKDIREIADRPPALAMDGGRMADEAARAMADFDCGAVVVTDNGVVRGIVTERDMVRKIVHEGRDAHTVSLNDIMTRQVEVATLEDELSEGLKKMVHGHFRHLPVVDEHGHVVSMLTERDFVPSDAAETFRLAKTITPLRFYQRFQPWLILVGISLYFVITTLIIWSYFGIS